MIFQTHGIVSVRHFRFYTAENEQKLVTLEQLREFLAATEEVEFQGCPQDEARYQNIKSVLKCIG